MRLCTAFFRPIMAGLLVLMLGLTPAVAKDRKIPMRKLGINLSGNVLLTTFGYRDAFTPEIRKKLRSGLPTRIVLQINLERQGKNKPVSYWARSINVVYDLWEELYIIAVKDNRGRRRAKVSTAIKAEELAGLLLRGQIASTARLPQGLYRLRVLIEVNPVSKEMVESIRRWLARPPSGKSGSLTKTNFFGSFVGAFVDRRIGQADHTVAFVSQWFSLGGP